MPALEGDKKYQRGQEKYLFVPPKPRFTNKVIDKKELKRLMAWAFSNYGTGRASYMADRLKELGFHYATRAGISLSVEEEVSIISLIIRLSFLSPNAQLR